MKSLFKLEILQALPVINFHCHLMSASNLTIHLSESIASELIPVPTFCPFTLNIPFAHSQISYKDNNKYRQHSRNNPITISQSSNTLWLPKPVCKGSSQWSGHDVGEPKCKNRIETEQGVAEPWEQEQYNKQYPRCQVAEM